MTSEKSLSPLVVEKSDVVFVKPSKPSPDVSLSLSTLDNDPYNEFHTQTIFVYAPKPYLDKQANHDPTFHLQLGLSHALVYYYPLAGKLHRKSDGLQLNCAVEDGVPFIKATAKCTLSSLSYLENVGDEAYQLLPCYNPVKDCEGYNPLALQVTEFACGGITIGMAMSHSVCDGVGMGLFYRAMLELASGKTEPTVIPVWKRERLTFNNTRDELGDEKEAELPYISTNDMVCETLNITSDDITKLKKIIKDEEQTSNKEDDKDVAVTTLEIIGALMWRAKCRALKLDQDGAAVLGIAIGIGENIEPQLPKGYYGNAWVKGTVSLTVKELRESTLSRLIRLIKDVKRAVLDKPYVLGRPSPCGVERNVGEMALFIALTDWRHIGLNYDFWGGLVNIVPVVPKTSSFVSVLLPASKAVQGMSCGGVRLMVMVPRDSMGKFKEEIMLSNY